MVCKNCGLEIKDGQKFCAGCGTSIEVASENQNISLDASTDTSVNSDNNINNDINNDINNNVETNTEINTNTDTNMNTNNNLESGKKRSTKFWVLLFGAEIVIFIGLVVLTFISCFSMFNVDIDTSKEKTLSILEKYEYTIQDNSPYLTDDDIFSYIAMKEDTTIEYYGLDDEATALSQYTELYNSIITDVAYNVYVHSSVNLGDYKKYVLSNTEKTYILILDEEDILFIKGDRAFANEYNAMLNEMGYKEIEFSPLFIISLVLLSLYMFAITYFIFWKLFKKAGLPGWYALIPFVNVYYIYKMSYGRGVYFLTIFIPLANVIFVYLTFYKLAKAFDKSDLFAILNIFLSIYTLQIIALDDSKYVLHMKGD